MKTRLLLALAALAVGMQYAHRLLGEGEDARILRPVDKSILPFGPVEMAVLVSPDSKPPAILLDGETLQLSKQDLSKGVFIPPAVIIVRELSPGSHELRAGKTVVRFFVRDEKGETTPPKGWSPYTSHPPVLSEAVTCTACHELGKRQRFTNMNSAFSLEEPTGCFVCHEETAFKVTHNHNYKPLAFCQMCHDPHGHTADGKLLKLSKEKACTLCHE